MGITHRGLTKSQQSSKPAGLGVAPKPVGSGTLEFPYPQSSRFGLVIALDVKHEVLVKRCHL